MIEKIMEGVYYCSDDELRPLTYPNFDIDKAYEEQEARRAAEREEKAERLRQRTDEAILAGKEKKRRLTPNEC